jgi:hypothetical protein
MAVWCVCVPQLDVDLDQVLSASSSTSPKSPTREQLLRDLVSRYRGARKEDAAARVRRQRAADAFLTRRTAPLDAHAPDIVSPSSSMRSMNA